MKAIFYAAGPEIRSGLTVRPTFENIHLYPLIAKILGFADWAGRRQLVSCKEVLKKPSPYRRRRARKRRPLGSESV